MFLDEIKIQKILLNASFLLKAFKDSLAGDEVFRNRERPGQVILCRAIS